MLNFLTRCHKASRMPYHCSIQWFLCCRTQMSDNLVFNQFMFMQKISTHINNLNIFNYLFFNQNFSLFGDLFFFFRISDQPCKTILNVFRDTLA